MGGKKKDAQRTKGNARPSSSGRAAEFLAAKAQGSSGNPVGFVGFDVQSLDVSYLPPVSAGQADSGTVCTDADFRMVLKKMTKRDAVTKLKALQEFAAFSKEKTEDSLIDVLQFWPRVYSKLTLEYDRRVREATQLAIRQLAVGASHHLTSLPPSACLRAMLGSWLLAQCDPHAPAASTAKSAFAVAFPLPADRCTVVLSCVNEVLAYLLDLLLNSSPATLSDAKTTPPEEMTEKHLRVLACSLRALCLILELVLEFDDGSVPLKVSQMEVAYRQVLSEAKLWKLAKHDSIPVKAGFYALLASISRHLPSLTSEKADKICPLVLACLNITEPTVSPFVWEAALHVLSTVKEWWKHVNVRKAMLPSLWSTLRLGGDGCASVVLPSCLPLLSLVATVDAVGDVHAFFAEFLGNIKTGLTAEKVQKSSSECAHVVRGFLECLRYAVQCELESGSSASSLSGPFVNVLLVGAVETSLVQPCSSLAHSPLYSLVGDLEANWKKRALAIKEESATTQQLLAAASYAELVSALWLGLTSASVKLASGNGSVGSEHISARLGSLINSLCCGALSSAEERRGRKVVFEDSASGGNGSTSRLTDSACGDWQASELDGKHLPVSKHSTELIELGASLSASLLALPGGEAAGGCSVASVTLLVQIVRLMACPEYYLAVVRASSPDAERAAVTSSCVRFIAILFDRLLELGEQQPAIVLGLIEAILAAGRHLEADARLAVLERLVSPELSVRHRLVVLTSVLGDMHWRTATRQWMHEPSFQEVFGHLVDGVMASVRAQAEISSDQLTALSNTMECLTIENPVLAEGISRIVRAVHASLGERPVKAFALVSCEFLHKVFASQQVPFEDKLLLALDFYGLLRDCPASDRGFLAQSCCIMVSCIGSSAEFCEALSSAVFTDVIAATTLSRLTEVTCSLLSLEPALSPSFLDEWVKNNVISRQLLDDEEQCLVQWLEVPALRCELIFNSYGFFPTVNSAATVRPDLPAAVPLVCVSLLLAKARVDTNRDSVSGDMCSSSADALSSRRRTFCGDASFLSVSTWVLGCCRAAALTYARIQATQSTYLAHIVEAMSEGLKTCAVWSQFPNLTRNLIESPAGQRCSQLAPVSVAVIINELFTLGVRFVLPDSHGLVNRLHEVSEVEFQLAHSLLITMVRPQYSEGMTDSVKEIICVTLMAHFQNASTQLSMNCVARTLFALGNAMLSYNSAPGADVCQSIVALLADRKKSSAHHFIFNRGGLRGCDAALVNWNVSVMRVLGAIVLKASTVLKTEHWDFVLCSLVAWNECLRRIEEQQTFSEKLFVANVASLTSVVAQCMKDQVAICPTDYPPNLATEWVELYCEELFKCTLPFFVSECDRLSKSMNGAQHFVACCMSRAISYCPLQQLLAHRLPTKLVPNQLWGSSLPVELEMLLNHLAPLVLSVNAAVQAAAYALLIKLMPELPKCDTKALTEDSEEPERQPPVTLMSVIDVCAHSIVPLLADTAVGEQYQPKPHSKELTSIRGYVLAWKLLLKYLQYCSTEVRAEYAEYLKHHDTVNAVLGVLLKLIPLERPHKVGTPFPKNVSLNMDGSSTQDELVALCCSLFYGLLKVLPVIVRRWCNELDKKTWQAIDRFTTKFVSADICSEEMDGILAGKSQLENLAVKVRPTAREIVAVYGLEEFAMELVIKLPANYPIGVTDVECTNKPGVAPAEWRTWMLQMTTFLTHQNGSITNAISLWKRNLDKKFEGVEECYICYSVLHGSNLQLPKLQCRTCRKKFHSACLYKWFTSSQKSTCPLCRNLF